MDGIVLSVGNIVYLDGEYGIVREVPVFNHENKYVSGELLIQWDSPHEDIEDCLGNLESLLIKVEEYSFKYIK